MKRMPSAWIVETTRIGLRPFREDDASALVRVFDDAYAKTFYPDMAAIPMADRWITRNLERYAVDGFGLWAACLKATGELVGDCGLVVQTVEANREVEVAYHLRADHRGRGLALEAATACLEHGFVDRNCERLVSMVHPANIASKRLAQRLHARVRRFERLGDRYYLFYTDRPDWSVAGTSAPGTGATDGNAARGDGAIQRGGPDS